MIYEVLHQSGEDDLELPPDTPLQVRVYPEDTDVRQMFVAMLQAAYGMKGVYALNGLGLLDAQDSLSEKEALKSFAYDSRRSVLDWILRRSDTRIPVQVGAGFVHGRAIRFGLWKSKEVPGAYDWNTIPFVRDVGSIDTLFERTEEILAQQE